MPATLSGRPTSVWMDTAPHTTYAAARGHAERRRMRRRRRHRRPAHGRAAQARRAHRGRPGGRAGRHRRHGLHDREGRPRCTGSTYDEVRSHFGEQGARHYAEANAAGLELIAARVAEREIDCDFRRRAAFTYSEDPGGLDALRAEVEAMRAAGLDAELVRRGRPAVGRRRRRAARTARPSSTRAGSCSRSPPRSTAAGRTCSSARRATGVDDGEPCRVRTEAGGEVVAADVVIATHYPTLDRGLFFARLAAERSYAIGVRARGRVPAGHVPLDRVAVALRARDALRRRRAADRRRREPQGGDRRPGRALRRARGVGARALRRRGGRVPLGGAGRDAGRRRPVRRPALTRRAATCGPPPGFKKWGITNGAAAALMLSGAIAGEPPAWLETFDANRFKPLAAAP